MKETKNTSAKYSQEQIQNALSLLLKKQSFEEISVKEILFEARVARKTFYRNFNSKQDVLTSLANKILSDYGKKISELDSENLTDFFDIVFETAKKEKNFFKLLIRQNLFHIIQEEMSRYIPKLHEEECEECTFFSGLTEKQTEYVITFNIGAIWNVVRKWIEEGMKTPEEEIKNGLIKFLSRLQ